MKLGKKGKQSDLLDALGGEAIIPQEEETTSSPSMGAPSVAPVTSTPVVHNVLPKVDQSSVHATIREHISLSLLRDGGLKSFELKGDLDLRITDPAVSKIRLALAPSTSRATDLGRDLQFQQHPQVAKFTAGASDRIIALKDPKRSFPVGQGLGVLRWRLSTKDESLVPLNSEHGIWEKRLRGPHETLTWIPTIARLVNCWPTPRGDGTFDVNIEYELEAEHMTLRNVTLTIPLP